MHSRVGHYISKKTESVGSVLSHHFHLPETSASELFRLGAIYLNKRRIFQDLSLQPKDYLRIHTQPKRYEVAHIDWKSRILKETKEYLIVNKPFGVPTHAALDNAIENLLEQMRLQTRTPLFVTQRLDVSVEGVIVLAKTKAFQATFNRWLSEKRVTKTYQALTQNSPPLGIFTHFMENSERAPKKISEAPIPNGLECVLEIEKVEPEDSFFKVTVKPITGRTHQIRAQLALLKSPILGDTMYGGASHPPYSLQRIALKCVGVGCPAFTFP